jgi:hypothetical protein
MAGKTLQGAKKSKPAPQKSPEKSRRNQQVIQGTPVEAGRKPVQAQAEVTAIDNTGTPGLKIGPGQSVLGKGGARISVPKKPDHSVVAKDEVAKVSQPDWVHTEEAGRKLKKFLDKNAPVQRGRAGALGGRKLRRERGNLR